MKIAIRLVIIVGALAIASPVEAIIGRPLTPMSYAGVARRTVRRNSYAAAASAAAITTLPAGCVAAGGVYTCGTTRYQAAFDGPTVVYQVVH